MTKRDPFKYFHSSPEIIRLAVMMYVRFPLSLRNVEDLLHDRGIDFSHDSVRFWWNRFDLISLAEVLVRRVEMAIIINQCVTVQRRFAASPVPSATCQRKPVLRFSPSPDFVVVFKGCSRRAVE
jgi:hypothetical protein